MARPIPFLHSTVFEVEPRPFVSVGMDSRHRLLRPIEIWTPIAVRDSQELVDLRAAEVINLVFNHAMPTANDELPVDHLEWIEFGDCRSPAEPH